MRLLRGDIGPFTGEETDFVNPVDREQGYRLACNYLALMNKEKREEAEEIAARVTHIEMAMEDAFQREFLKALAMPYLSTGGPS
ncbi:MAG: ASKHA domain-containing protein [Thermodesulfobacteriota bacterium]